MKKQFVILNVIVFGFLNAVFGQLDSLEKSLLLPQNDTIKLQTLTDLNWEYLSIDLNKARIFAETEFELASKIKNKKFIAQGLNDIGIVLIKENKFKESLKYQKDALAIRLTLGNKSDIASSYSKIGYCYTETDEFKLALAAQLSALAIYKEIDSKIHIAKTINNICHLYNSLNNFDKAYEYAQLSYKIALEINDDYTIATALENLSNYYEKTGDFKTAIKTEMKSLNIFYKLNDSTAIAAVLNNIGFYYDKIKEYKTALNYYLKALAIAEKINDINSAGIFSNNIGNIYCILKDYKNAELHLKKSEIICKEQSIESTLFLTYKSLGDLYAITGKGELAVAYYNKFSLLKDSIFNIDLATQVGEMQTKFETNEKEAANILLQKENEITTAQLNKSNIIKWSLVLGIILVILVSYLFYNRYKLKQKSVLDAEILRQQEENSKAIIDAEERERTRIARDLHDGIGQQLSAAKLNLAALKSFINPQETKEITLFENATGLIDEAVNEVRSVSHNMMTNSLIKHGLISAVRDFINKLNQSAGLKINIETYGIDERLESTVEMILFRVLQELVNNILKHAHATEVSIQFVKHENELSLIIEDNGVGFDTKNLGNFEGIGLKNIQSRIKYINGKVFFDSYLTKGTTVNIEVPL
ncbi:MAG: tetratricopeptide repeat-containing sensor histidine kinase [Bacteroidia bacterium]